MVMIENDPCEIKKSPCGQWMLPCMLRTGYYSWSICKSSGVVGVVVLSRVIVEGISQKALQNVMVQTVLPGIAVLF